MNRYILLGSQVDAAGQEWAYIFDSETGETVKSPVRAVGKGVHIPPLSKGITVSEPWKFAQGPSAPAATAAAVDTLVKKDPTGEMETPEERAARITKRKVPPAFLGNTAKMHVDPSKSADGTTDVTPHS